MSSKCIHLRRVGLVLLCIRIQAMRVIFQNATAAAGDDAKLFCQLIDTTKTLTSVTWQRRTAETAVNTDFFAVTLDGKEESIESVKNRVTFKGNIAERDGSILLRSVSGRDEGTYTCVFSVFKSGLSIAEVHLEVQAPPVVRVSSDGPAVAGDTKVVLATCTAAHAKPAAEVLWSLGVLKDSVTVETNISKESEGRYTVKSSLIGQATKNLNQKKVQCLVKHPALKKELELNYTLSIHYPPQLVFIISASDHTETATFYCEADANPKPTNFTWSRHFPPKEPLSSGVNNTQTIQLTPGSTGLYFCVASNQHGDGVGSLFVHVKPPEESKTCWTLFTIAIIAVVCLLIWTFRLPHRLLKLRRRSEGLPAPTEPSDQLETFQ